MPCLAHTPALTAAWWIDIPPYYSNIESLHDDLAAGTTLWNPSILNNQCGTVADPPQQFASCFFADNAVKWVTELLAVYKPTPHTDT